MRRTLERHGVRPSDPPVPDHATGLTPPVFAPRRDLATMDGDCLVTHFIGTTVPLRLPIDWGHVPATRSRQLWRMNLHYMEFLESVDDTSFVALIDSWIVANPVYRRGSDADAWNAYALSIRVVVWCQQLSVRRDRLPCDFCARLLDSLAHQIRYLLRHLERDIGGNHLVKNIKALLIAACHFDGTEPARWSKRGLVLLRQALRDQFLSDGMHFELSPSYHCQVVADLLEIRAVVGPAVQSEITELLEPAVRIVANLTHPDGLVAQFSDAGLHMAYSPAELACAFDGNGRIEPHDRFTLPSAGYFGCRDDAGNALMIDAGRIAADNLPAHGHGDIFSFEWSVAGRRMIVDQGVYEYIDGERRRTSRTAASHNTLSIAGMDQGEFFGAFRLGRRAAVETEYRYEEDRVIVTGTHDGYVRYRGPKVVRRFNGTARSFRIDDQIDHLSTAHVRTSLLLAPEVSADPISAGKVRITCGRATAVIAGPFEFDIEPAVWWPDMGIEIPTKRLVMAWPRDVVAASLTFATQDGPIQ
ncbi:alginate lyase family protein [Sphingomonas sp.]|uniref:alginate lyase family protein n=1 Tax=Sphingomonas sp. TaxID=28214 RepID=UPI0025DCD8F4|nr:alginate lyase family protein [Sphingomonas sp.]